VGVLKLRGKVSQFRINGSFHYHRRGSYPEPDEDVFQPIGKNSLKGVLDRGGEQSMTLRIDGFTSAEDGSDSGFIGSEPRVCLIKARQDLVILMKDVDPAAAGSVDTAVPVSGHSQSVRLPVNAYPPIAENVP